MSQNTEEYHVHRSKLLILLQNMGFDETYIQRACTIYEKTYGLNYENNTKVIRGIIATLQNNERMNNINSANKLNNMNSIQIYDQQDTFYKIGKSMSLRSYNDDIQGVLMILNNWNTAYGSFVINRPSSPQAIYQWQIKIKQQDKKENNKIIIGLVTRRDKENMKHIVFGYCNNGQKIHYQSLQNYAIPYGDTNNNDIIKMELNLFTKTLKYYKNNCDLGVAFENIDFIKNAFCLAISLSGHVEAKLMRFQISISNCENQIDNNNKQLQMEEEKEKNKKLKIQNRKLNKLYEEINECILLTENTLKIQATEMNEFHMQINTLQNAWKQIETENLKLKHELNILKLKDIDEINYEKWDTKQLINWIINLDESYKQYQHLLQEVLFEQKMDGSSLQFVLANDIKNWGITNFKHRKHILHEIKCLINKKQDKNIQEELQTIFIGKIC